MQGGFGGAHPAQDGFGQQQAQRNEDHRDEQAQVEAVHQGTADAREVPTAEVLADEDAHTHVDADHQGGQQHDDGRGAAHGGQGSLAQIPAHHHAVGDGVGLVEQIASRVGRVNRHSSGAGRPAVISKYLAMRTPFCTGRREPPPGRIEKSPCGGDTDNRSAPGCRGVPVVSVPAGGTQFY